MKKKKNYFQIFLTVSVVFVLCLSILTVASFAGHSSHLHDDIHEQFDDISLDQFDSVQQFDDDKNTAIELIFGDQKFVITENLTENLQQISQKLYIPSSDAKILFEPDNDEVFVFQDEVIGQEVDVASLTNLIKDNLKHKRNQAITIPTMAIQPEIKKADLEGAIHLRSEFSTSIVGSQAGRKHNVTYALKAFNGMVVLPGRQVSFNQTTGERTFSDKYQDATIISGGEYVQGKGGGVCQASTTLYNALIRANVQIDEVNNLSLPV